MKKNFAQLKDFYITIKTFYVILFIFMLHLSAGVLHAQTGAFLIPRQIFVGDPAVLVVPLPAAAVNEDTILEKSSIKESIFPPDPNIDFYRITLERRTSASRLMIEFTAFVSGTVELPIIEIGGEYFSGLKVTVNSIIDKSSTPLLSAPASALAMPGTAAIIYSAMAVIFFLIMLTIWFFLKGRVFLKGLIKKWKYRLLLASIRKTEKNLQKAIQKGIDKRIILDNLSDKFRDFLSALTETNCRTMTSREFEEQENGLFLSNFFRNCDELRFSGLNIRSNDILKLLDDLRTFVNMLDDKTKDKEKEVKAE
ncbi:MAG: hypothetical protein LBI28_00365 [Treponema sp.]|jgi:hypothetical protein|nr:hypothetical protein [Treponema sp.]